MKLPDGRERGRAPSGITVALPEVPTIAEFVPSYEASAWYGLAAPRNTPAEIIEKLNTQIGAGLAEPKLKARLADLGALPLVAPPPILAAWSQKNPRNGAAA